MWLRHDLPRRAVRFRIGNDARHLNLLLYPRIRQNLLGFFEIDLRLDVSHAVGTVIHYVASRPYGCFGFWRTLPTNKDLVKVPVVVPPFLLDLLRDFSSKIKYCGIGDVENAAILFYNVAQALGLDHEAPYYRNDLLRLNP